MSRQDKYQLYQVARDARRPFNEKDLSFDTSDWRQGMLLGPQWLLRVSLVAETRDELLSRRLLVLSFGSKCIPSNEVLFSVFVMLCVLTSCIKLLITHCSRCSSWSYFESNGWKYLFRRRRALERGWFRRTSQARGQDDDTCYNISLSWWQSSDMGRRWALTHCGIKKWLTQISRHDAPLRSNDMW